MVGTTLMPMKTNIYEEYGVKWCENTSIYMKEYMRIYNSEKIHCNNCNKSLVRGCLQRHLRSKYHLKRV